MQLKPEVVKRHIDESECDWCGAPAYVGERVYVCLEYGTAYCSRACAQHDAFDRGYGPVCGSVSRWEE